MADEEKGMQPETAGEPGSQAANQPVQGGNSTPDTLEDAFFGSYDHAIDGKGRIIVPSDYRDALGKLFTIGPTRDMKAIALYPQRVWREVLTELTELKRLHGGKPKVQLYLNRFFKFSYPKAESDNQGRLLLPAKLRQEMLGEARDVEISGALDHIRIIDSGKAAAEDQFYKENEQDILEYLGSLEG